MNIEANGIVLKNIQIAGNRRLITIITKEYGKITANINNNSMGKNKSNLWSKPFSYSKFEIYKNKDYYIVNKGSIVRSYYKIGENIDKYMVASYVFELTDKILQENQRNIKQVDLLLDFLEILEIREKYINTLVLAYKIKTISLNGIEPNLKSCCNCGTEKNLENFSIVGGGVICIECKNKKLSENNNEKLIYDCKFGIIGVIEYILANSLHKLKNLKLENDIEILLEEIVTKYINHHLDLGKLKTESFLN